MLIAEKTQSLNEFKESALETLQRLNETGDAEVITVDGEARAIVLSPAAFDALAKEVELAELVADIQVSLRQAEAGQTMEVHEFFEELRAELLAMKAQKENEHK